MASRCWTWARSICCLKSGPESTTITFPLLSIKKEVRNRLSRGSSEVQTSQLQAITGTACEVPVPKKDIVTVLVLFVATADEKQFAYRRAGYNPFPARGQAHLSRVFYFQAPKIYSLPPFCCLAINKH